MGISAQGSTSGLPLWLRWVLSILGFTMLTVAIVIAVHAINNSGSSSSERSAAIEADRESQILIEEDQEPHSTRFRTNRTASGALQAAISRDMQARIQRGQLDGPLQGVRCAATGDPRGARRAFRCSARAAGVVYPFLGVLNRPARRLTWCKVDPAPVSNGPMEIPVSPRCRV